MIKISSLDKLLAAFILFIAAMLLVRIAYANNLRYIFLLWNLFLAWIPFQLSVSIHNLKLNNRIKYVLIAAWLLFFPNALYIITDLIHLENSKADVPVWFDAILIFTSSVTGLILAFASLFLVERFLQNKLAQNHINKLLVGALFLGSFGVYIGRFLRWNSWDILANPVSLLVEIATHIIMPVQHFRTWVVTFLLTGLFSLLYFSIKKIPGYLQQPGI